jgi:hypothetical protein
MMSWIDAAGASRIALMMSLGVAICAASSVGASAHPGHSHSDGRISGHPDFKRIGKVEVRFHPERAEYAYTRPNEKPLWFHRDPIPFLIGAHNQLPTEEEPIVCATSGHRIRVMYAGPSNAVLTTEEAAAIRNYVRRMNWKVLSESVRSSGYTRALRMRVDCAADGTINIWQFVSASGAPEQVWGRAETVYGYPTGADSVKNLIFFDGDDPSGEAAGYGQMANDSIKSESDSANGSRARTSSAVLYKGALGNYWADHTTLHELFHTMGAVNSRAPFGTDGNHCIDGLDVMCYEDGSIWYLWPPEYHYSDTRCPSSSGYNTPIGVPLDCSYDSYFDAAEESGEWLNTHWNPGGAENPFLVQAPTPRIPTVATRAVSFSSDHGAIMRATINANGLVTQYRFEYGLTAAYGTNLPLPDGRISSDLYADRAISQATYTNLQPGTTYHYRVVASNASGTSTGPDQVFTTPSWEIRPTVNSAGASDSYLYSVGCEPSSADLCTAVGESTSAGVDTPMAHRWDGTSWSSQAPALKAGATHTRLFGVNCPSGIRCIAVGNSESSGSTATLAELWNENRWTIQTTPIPSGATSSELTDVGCSSTANCSAVGSATIGGVRTAIAERWNSPTWAIHTIPIPAGATSSQLDGVDCLWSNFCVAVGRYTTSGGAIRSLALFWNGTSWALQTPTEPGGASQSTLLDVSCTPSPNLCTAVGGWKNGSQQLTLAYRFNGTSWTLQSTLNPSESIASVFQDVSCATATSCTAVGSWVSGSGGSNQTLAESWGGSSWSIQSTPNPPGMTFSAFFGASCRGIRCVAVGWNTNSAGAASTLGEIRE